MTLITRYKDTPTSTVDIGGARFAYRQLGPNSGTPVIFLNHLAAVLDNWDPRVVDGIAARHRVITFDNRGIGASKGRTPHSVAARMPNSRSIRMLDTGASSSITKTLSTKS